MKSVAPMKLRNVAFTVITCDRYCPLGSNAQLILINAVAGG
jgi:hypothetical protein